MTLPFVSIIIPTYNDWARMSLCIQSLVNQTYDTNSFEFIIVNNNPLDAKPMDVCLPINCILLNESKSGSYAARNKALSVAKGEIIGFTDSDCIVDKDWITNAVEIFTANENIQRIGGAIKLFYKHQRPSKVELHDFVFAFPQEEYVKSGNAVTANMFSRKSVFDSIGPFDDSLMSGGDYQWGVLAHKSKFTIIYAPNVIINHPARDSIKELIKKEKRVVKGQVNFKTAKKKKGMVAVVEFAKIFKPRMWEIKKIFDKGKDLNFTDKVSVVLIRHYTIFVGNIFGLFYTKK
jgi:glycosyltransferase involved in cell wall biosynthesis